MSGSVKQGRLGQLLYPIMKKRNMSVQALAAAVGVKRDTCYAWLHEYRRPKLESLRSIAHVLNIPVADLIAATYTNVNGARLESLLEVYLNLSDDRRRLLEAVAKTFAENDKQNPSKN